VLTIEKNKGKRLSDNNENLEKNKISMIINFVFWYIDIILTPGDNLLIK
jgi:hypothetical protein